MSPDYSGDYSGDYYGAYIPPVPSDVSIETRRSSMTATSERLAFIEEYKIWREERELSGLPSGLDAYAEDLRIQEPARQLAEINTLAIELGIKRGPEAGHFADAVQVLLGINPKEIATA